MVTLAELSQRIHGIARSPDSERVFGAAGRTSGHRFERFRVSREQISNLEDSLEIKLPPDYIDLIRTIGANIGPYYGLYVPELLLKEMASLIEDNCWDDDRPPSPSCVFPIIEQDLADLKARIAEGSKLNYIKKQSCPSDGCIIIGEQGCSYYTALVTAGEFAGTVWDVDAQSACYMPANRPTGIAGLNSRADLPAIPVPPTFMEWYASWVEAVELDIQYLPNGLKV